MKNLKEMRIMRGKKYENQSTKWRENYTKH